MKYISLRKGKRNLLGVKTVWGELDNKNSVPVGLPKQKILNRLPEISTETLFPGGRGSLGERQLQWLLLKLAGISSEDHKSFSPTTTIRVCSLLYFVLNLKQQEKHMEVRKEGVKKMILFVFASTICHISKIPRFLVSREPVNPLLCCSDFIW